MLTNKELILILKTVLYKPKAYTGTCENIALAGKKLFVSDFGIKDYVFIFSVLRPLIKKWPKYSGNIYYFICHESSKRDPAGQYEICEKYRSFWLGRQGELRRECLKFLIAELEKEELQ
jgi:hypothetical protein